VSKFPFFKLLNAIKLKTTLKFFSVIPSKRRKKISLSKNAGIKNNVFNEKIKKKFYKKI
jgi:hypothetical protein